MLEISLMHSSVAGNNFVGFETPIQEPKQFWGNFEQPERYWTTGGLLAYICDLTYHEHLHFYEVVSPRSGLKSQ